MTPRPGSTRGRSDAYRTVIFREQPGNEVYSLYANQSGSQFPTGEVFVGGYKDAQRHRRPAAQQLDAPGRDLRRLLGAPLRERDARLDHARPRAHWPARPRRLRIGGNSIWGEYFSGLIDEVRVYNRALSAAEIQTGHDNPDLPTDTQAPSARPT